MKLFTKKKVQNETGFQSNNCLFTEFLPCLPAVRHNYPREATKYAQCVSLCVQGCTAPHSWSAYSHAVTKKYCTASCAVLKMCGIDKSFILYNNTQY